MGGFVMRKPVIFERNQKKYVVQSLWIDELTKEYCVTAFLVEHGKAIVTECVECPLKEISAL